jgi:hypothetical protein
MRGCRGRIDATWRVCPRTHNRWSPGRPHPIPHSQRGGRTTAGGAGGPAGRGSGDPSAVRASVDALALDNGPARVAAGNDAIGVAIRVGDGCLLAHLADVVDVWTQRGSTSSPERLAATPAGCRRPRGPAPTAQNTVDRPSREIVGGTRWRSPRQSSSEPTLGFRQPEGCTPRTGQLWQTSSGTRPFPQRQVRSCSVHCDRVTAGHFHRHVS